MKTKTLIVLQVLLLNLFLSLIACKNNTSANQSSNDNSVPCQTASETTVTKAIESGDFKAYKVNAPIQIDGCSKDVIWSQTDWYAMNYLWMGNPVATTDYYGRFKLTWDSQYLYILVEVIDDTLNPTLENGIENYWKGDYVEVFLDEDQSGGVHQFNHQAFAYHVSTEGHAIDLNTLKEAVFFDNHVEVARSQKGNTHLWEMAIRLFDNQFDETSTSNKPVNIVAQKRIGFSLAYGDNDGNNSRENFMGSKKTHGNNNDKGYINADVFGSILFID